jgi:hypothetical protein
MNSDTSYARVLLIRHPSMCLFLPFSTPFPYHYCFLPYVLWLPVRVTLFAFALHYPKSGRVTTVTYAVECMTLPSYCNGCSWHSIAEPRVYSDYFLVCSPLVEFVVGLSSTKLVLTGFTSWVIEFECDAVSELFCQFVNVTVKTFIFLPLLFNNVFDCLITP